jgi:hypothetical protein
MRPFMLVALCALPACDSASDLLVDPDAGPAEVVLEQPDDQTLAELTADDTAAICAALFAAVDRQVPAATKCVIVGYTAIGTGSMAEQAAACAEAADTCEGLVRLGQQSLPPVTPGECGLFKGDTSQCTTTVGELRACLDLMADASVGAIRETLTCELLATTEVPTITPPPAVVPEGAEECAKVRRTCPGVFEEN